MIFLYFADAQCSWSGLINNLLYLESARFSILSNGKIELCPGAPMDADWMDVADQHEARVLMEAAFERESGFSVRVTDKTNDVGFICSVNNKAINITVPESTMSQEGFMRATMELLFQLGAKVERIEFSDDMGNPSIIRRP